MGLGFDFCDWMVAVWVLSFDSIKVTTCASHARNFPEKFMQNEDSHLTTYTGYIFLKD